MSRQILVTSALPYANGPIHVGHLVEYIQTDIWVRFQKLAGNRCIYLCADDTHGTAIMISAKKAGVSEERFIARMNDEHQRDFAEHFKARYGPTITTRANAERNGRADELDAALDRFSDDWNRGTEDRARFELEYLLAVGTRL